MGLGDPANLRKGTAEDLPPPTGDPLTDAINRAAVFSFFYPPYRDQVLAMIRGYAPVLGLNAQSDWNSIFKKTLDYQFGRYNNWSTYDNPSQTFFKVIEQNELPNREQVKSYIQGTSQYQQEAQSFTNAWNESNKSSGSFFNDVLTVAAIAVAIAYPQLAGYILKELVMEEEVRHSFLLNLAQINNSLTMQMEQSDIIMDLYLQIQPQQFL